MYAVTGYLYKNGVLLLRGMKEDLENFVEELKDCNKNWIDRTEFEIKDNEGHTIKKWNRK